MIRLLAQWVALKIVRRILRDDALPSPTPEDMRPSGVLTHAVLRRDGTWLCYARSGDIRVFTSAPDSFAAHMTLTVLRQHHQRMSIQ